MKRCAPILLLIVACGGSPPVPSDPEPPILAPAAVDDGTCGLDDCPSFPAVAVDAAWLATRDEEETAPREQSCPPPTAAVPRLFAVGTDGLSEAAGAAPRLVALDCMEVEDGDSVGLEGSYLVVVSGESPVLVEIQDAGGVSRGQSECDGFAMELCSTAGLRVLVTRCSYALAGDCAAAERPDYTVLRF